MRGTEIVFNCAVEEVLEIDDRKLLGVPESERIFEVLDGRGSLIRNRDVVEFDLEKRRIVFSPTMRVEENEGFISIWNQESEECAAAFPKSSILSVRQVD